MIKILMVDSSFSHPGSWIPSHYVNVFKARCFYLNSTKKCIVHVKALVYTFLQADLIYDHLTEVSFGLRLLFL